ncbi:hypothetical protein CCACVL1_09521 [Corchorus capsularis]|uniref:RRM domain-containing protein n=1 Tax=Corchorus capsularis TaxID=210143 RepID=A0A1R3IVV6_COCAP|nr:hypothetical protein CCACVL1_09521 [Corchorus capsularis]
MEKEEEEEEAQCTRFPPLQDQALRSLIIYYIYIWPNKVTDMRERRDNRGFRGFSTDNVKRFTGRFEAESFRWRLSLKSIFVSNLSDGVSRKDLWESFNDYSVVVDVFLLVRKSHDHGRFAFIRDRSVKNSFFSKVIETRPIVNPRVSGRFRDMTLRQPSLLIPKPALVAGDKDFIPNDSYVEDSDSFEDLDLEVLTPEDHRSWLERSVAVTLKPEANIDEFSSVIKSGSLPAFMEVRSEEQADPSNGAAPDANESNLSVMGGKVLRFLWGKDNFQSKVSNAVGATGRARCYLCVGALILSDEAA